MKKIIFILLILTACSSGAVKKHVDVSKGSFLVDSIYGKPIAFVTTGLSKSIDNINNTLKDYDFDDIQINNKSITKDSLGSLLNDLKHYDRYDSTDFRVYDTNCNNLHIMTWFNKESLNIELQKSIYTARLDFDTITDIVTDYFIYKTDNNKRIHLQYTRWATDKSCWFESLEIGTLYYYETYKVPVNGGVIKACDSLIKKSNIIKK
jgi:hypothetical protein